MNVDVNNEHRLDPDPSFAERELLLAAAPLARQWAARLCRGTNSGGVCAQYHGIRPYWRALDLVSSPEQHPFYGERIKSYFQPGQRIEVLVSGCADFGQLAAAMQGCRAAGVEAGFTVVDQCRTPLEMCRWYARRQDLEVCTVLADIRRFERRRQFDLICTHSFLGWFTPAARRGVIAKWRELLRPGGVALTVSRVRPPRPDRGAGRSYNQAETDAFCALVEERARLAQQRLDVSPSQLVEWARVYHAGHRAYGIYPDSDLAGDFRLAGFDVEVVELDPPERPEWRSATGAGRAVEYRGIAAVRAC